jgi:hypothetical protein
VLTSNRGIDELHATFGDPLLAGAALVRLTSTNWSWSEVQPLDWLLVSGSVPASGVRSPLG